MIYATFVPLIVLSAIMFLPCTEWSVGVFYIVTTVCQTIAECKYQSLLDRVKELERKSKGGEG